MARLSPTDLDVFVRRVNQDNFILFAKLLNLQDQDSFRTVIELLADNRINLSMLADLLLEQAAVARGERQPRSVCQFSGGACCLPRPTDN